MTNSRTAPVVVLTGASSGIGAALAVAFARERGARIGLVARRAQELEGVAADVRAAGGEALAVPADVTDADAVQAAVASVVSAFGPVDIAIANAGIGVPMPMARFDAAVCSRSMRVNFEGATNLFAAVVPAMWERRAGHIVGVSSIANFRGLPGAGPYSASKAALTTFLESMRLELKPRGVGVTAVHPGFVRTAMTDKNTFEMPFLMELDAAAALLERKLRKQPREVEFPWQMAMVGRLSRRIPDWLYDRLLRGRNSWR